MSCRWIEVDCFVLCVHFAILSIFHFSELLNQYNPFHTKSGASSSSYLAMHFLWYISTLHFHSFWIIFVFSFLPSFCAVFLDACRVHMVTIDNAVWSYVLINTTFCRLCSVCHLILCRRYFHRCRRCRRRHCRWRRQVDDGHARIICCLYWSYWPVIVNWSTRFVTNTSGGNNNLTNASHAPFVMLANRSYWDRANCIRTQCAEHLTTSNLTWIFCVRPQPLLLKKSV